MFSETFTILIFKIEVIYEQHQDSLRQFQKLQNIMLFKINVMYQLVDFLQKKKIVLATAIFDS